MPGGFWSLCRSRGARGASGAAGFDGGDEGGEGVAGPGGAGDSDGSGAGGGGSRGAIGGVDATDGDEGRAAVGPGEGGFAERRGAGLRRSWPDRAELDEVGIDVARLGVARDAEGERGRRSLRSTAGDGNGRGARSVGGGDGRGMCGGGGGNGKSETGVETGCRSVD